MPAHRRAPREFWLAGTERYCGSQVRLCEGIIRAEASSGGLFEAAGISEVPRRGLERPPIGAGRSEVVMGRIYLVCDRCSRTVDLGLDRSNPDPIFMVGYCRRCSEFLLRQELNGGHQRRLDSTVLIRSSNLSEARTEPDRSEVLVGV